MRLLLFLVAVLLVPAALGQQMFPGQGNQADWLKANGLYAEGNILCEQKNYPAAVQKYKEAIGAYPSDFHYHYNLAQALKHIGDLNGAVQSLKSAAELKKSDWKIHVLLGNTLYKLGRMNEARSAFLEAMTAGPPQKEVGYIKSALAAIDAAQKRNK